MNKMDTEYLYREHVSSTNEERVRLIESVLDFLESQKVHTLIDRYEFYLILDEAISNAMEHGNSWGSDKKVLLKVTKPESSSIEVIVSDEGNGFDPEEIPDMMGDKKNLSLRGRGIFIMRKFCSVGWNKKGNEISLTIKIKN